ncbi:hypothetical protein [Bacillus sp. FJAT-27445]|uniref:hypothetical protein n=1 Tax=Bacillus sp. FJAT-27445 TaxID=1679166 RepID=UPI00074424CF|nr:hypothetical protein [Bacillus sp. FJAT-27445]
MKYFLFLVIMSVSLIGCEQQAENSMKDKIQFVPNEDYVGDPSPTVKKEMKLTNEEKVEFEKLQKEILEKKEDE